MKGASLSIILLLFFSSLSMGSMPSFVNGEHAYVVSSSANSTYTNIGIWCQSGGCFDGGYTMLDMDAFYNATFGSGSFNSIEMYTPQDLQWFAGNNLYTQQIQELALDSAKYGGDIKLGLAVSMDFHYNGTTSNGCNANIQVYKATNYCNPDYNILENFLATDAQYPALYSVGVNVERGMMGCENFDHCNLNADPLGNAVANQSINFFVNMVNAWGKQSIFSSASLPGHLIINPGPNKNWQSFCGADSVNNYPTSGESVGNIGAAYWYAGCHGNKQIPYTNSSFIYVGIVDGMFNPYNQPASYYETQVSDGVTYPNVPAGAPVIVYNVTNGVAYGTPCTWTSWSDTNDVAQTNPGCAPSGQWNQNSVNWWFQQQNNVYSLYPSNRQFVMMGMDSITNKSGQVLIYPNIDNPFKYWNSLQFECSVLSAEASAGIATPHNVTISHDLPCRGIVESDTTETYVSNTSTATSNTSLSTSESLQFSKTSTTVPITSTSNKTSVQATNPVYTNYVVALGFLLATVSGFLTFTYTKRKKKARQEPTR